MCPLSTVDPDPGQSFTYTMINTGSGQFGISGSNLVTTAMLNFLASSAVAISSRSTDNGAPPPTVGGAAQAALSYAQSFTIIIVKSPRPPAVSDTVMTVPENALFGTVVGAINMAPGADAIPLNFTINSTTSDKYIAPTTTRGCAILQPGYAFFRAQLCSGTVFVNTVSSRAVLLPAFLLLRHVLHCIHSAVRVWVLVCRAA